jgi:hypothetical protein
VRSSASQTGVSLTLGGDGTIEELARIQHAQPVADPDDLVADIWESDEELDAFLADLRAARNASLA